MAVVEEVVEYCLLIGFYKKSEFIWNITILPSKLIVSVAAVWQIGLSRLIPRDEIDD